MAKHQHVAQRENPSVMDDSLQEAVKEKLPIDEMPLENIRDYRLYNEEARKLNKKLRVCRYLIKQCPVELHPTQRVRFSNNDKSLNPIQVFVSNHLIHFDMKLEPGKTYDLPECIVHYLSEKGYPVWDWVTLKDGSRETREVNKTPRFSLTSIWKDDGN
jgi:hypothetical protein